MTINILGVEYEVLVQDEKENPKIKDCDGICEWVVKQIIIDTSYKNDPENLDGINSYIHKVLRHEAFHALFAEMGINKWMSDEDLVDMLAMQYPKIRRIMDELDGMSIEELEGKDDSQHTTTD